MEICDSTGNWSLADLVPIALGMLATVILLIFVIKLTEPEGEPPRQSEASISEAVETD